MEHKRLAHIVWGLPARERLVLGDPERAPGLCRRTYSAYHSATSRVRCRLGSGVRRLAGWRATAPLCRPPGRTSTAVVACRCGRALPCPARLGDGRLSPRRVGFRSAPTTRGCSAGAAWAPQLESDTHPATAGGTRRVTRVAVVGDRRSVEPSTPRRASDIAVAERTVAQASSEPSCDWAIAPRRTPRRSGRSSHQPTPPTRPAYSIRAPTGRTIVERATWPGAAQRGPRDPIHSVTPIVGSGSTGTVTRTQWPHARQAR
jgi:hypothetical protein